MTERFHKRLILGNPRLINRYLESKLHILVWLSVGHVCEQYIACFQRAQIVGWPEKDRSQRLNTALLRERFEKMSHGDRTEVQAAIGRPGCNNQSVFVDVVKAVEGPKIGPLPPPYGSSASIALMASGLIPFILAGPSDLNFAESSAIGKATFLLWTELLLPTR